LSHNAALPRPILDPVAYERRHLSRGVDPEGAPDWLLELPHAATRESYFDVVRQRLTGDLPGDLKDYFFVNTDAGAPEYAEQTARMIVEPRAHAQVVELLPRAVLEAAERLPRHVWVIGSRLPRTFIDCNRRLDLDPARFEDAKLNTALPEYIRDPQDRMRLSAAHETYRQRIDAAYCDVCENGGRALQLHTYAPRSIQIESYDENIGEALRRAYEPEAYAGWPRRPDVELIFEDDDGRFLGPPGLVDRLRDAYAKIGVAAAENTTYRLHPPSVAHHFATRYPGQVMCIEISREQLADPFTPFAEMRIDPAKAERFAAPLAAACLALMVEG